MSRQSTPQSAKRKHNDENDENVYNSAKKSRSSLKFTTSKGSKEEKQDVLDQFKTSLHKLIKQESYLPEQIFFFDESGLIWKNYPAGCWVFANEPIRNLPPRGTCERINLSMCSNKSNDFKLPLFMINKSNISTLSSAGADKLPFYFVHQEKKMKNFDVFQEWFNSQFIPKVEEYLEENNMESKALLVANTCTKYGDDFESDCGKFRCLMAPYKCLNQLAETSTKWIKDTYRHKIFEDICKDGRGTDKYLNKLEFGKAADILMETWDEMPESKLNYYWKQLGFEIPVTESKRALIDKTNKDETDDDSDE